MRLSRRGPLRASEDRVGPRIDHTRLRHDRSHEIDGRHVQAHHVFEIRRGLVGREAQIERSDFDQVATRLQSGER